MVCRKLYLHRQHIEAGKKPWVQIFGARRCRTLLVADNYFLHFHGGWTYVMPVFVAG